MNVTIETSKGIIVAELDQEKAPVTVDNFLTYTREGHYDGTIFHRVISGFMIQGGGITADMNDKSTHKPITNEADNGLKNLRGTLTMARTSQINSATSQFFINLVDNAFLEHRDKSAQGYGYAVFGRVIEGIDVVDAIAGVETGSVGGYSDVPVESVVINKVIVAE
ncbi:MAG: peptidylprolyl isomerase [bacterium]